MTNLLDAYNMIDAVVAFYSSNWAEAYDYLSNFVQESLVFGNFSTINTLCLVATLKDYPKELLEILYVATGPGEERLPDRKLLEEKINPSL